MDNLVTFYGVRGSLSAIGKESEAYGKETSFYSIKLGNDVIFADAGTGVHNAAPVLDLVPEVHIVITHPHIDHIQGILDVAKYLADKPIHLYGAMHEGRSLKEQIAELMGPPLWPVTLDDVKDVTYHDLTVGETFHIGDTQISTMESNHPGGSLIFRFDGNGKSVVLATDFCHEGKAEEELVTFAKGADMLIYDGSMTEEEYEKHGDWGHSTPSAGIRIANAAGVDKLAFTHHDTTAWDSYLDQWEHEVRKERENTFFAYNGLIQDLDRDIPGYVCSGWTSTSKDSLKTLMDVCVQLTSEKDKNKLFEYIIRSAMEVTRADAGTLYLMGEKGLDFTVMITKSMGVFKGGNGDPIELPPVKLTLSNVAAASAILRQLINIPDVYDNQDFDFSGPRKYDAVTGFHTKSVLVVPMEDPEGAVIGVLQLINATGPRGEILTFGVEDEQMVQAIASQAAIAISNMRYFGQITDLLYEFIQAISTGIDSRTPYNVNHTRNMVEYGKNFIKYENEKDGYYQMNEDQRNEFLMSIWLHDVGKIATPLEIMDKSDRLGEKYGAQVESRYEKMEILLHLQEARGELSKEEFEAKLAELHEEHEFILKINQAGFLPDENFIKLEEIAFRTYKDLDGSEQPHLTPEELHELSIRKGTLTAEEREIMQDHVVVTGKILEKLTFPKKFKHIPEWAASHHEFLDGSGYPKKLTEHELVWQARIITIFDIFDALTAADRPYRKSMPLEKAFDILQSMVDEGKLDGTLLAEFKESQAWVGVTRMFETM